MSVDGLWTSEIYGLQGWENTGAVVLQRGQVMGGGRNHYTVGTYSLSENDISLSIDITYHTARRERFSDRPIRRSRCTSMDATTRRSSKARYTAGTIPSRRCRSGLPRGPISREW